MKIDIYGESFLDEDIIFISDNSSYVKTPNTKFIFATCDEKFLP